MDTPLAALQTTGDVPVLRFERLLAHPPEKVWRAVTDPAEMVHWFPAEVSTELAVGATMRFSVAAHNPDVSDEGFEDGEVLELDPPKVYAFRWTDLVLRFELLPAPSGCRLVFTSTLPGTGTHGDLPSTARTAPGWDACLAFLAARLDGRPEPVFPDNWMLHRAEQYVEEFGLGEGSAEDTRDGYAVRFERDLVQPVDEVWHLLTAADGAPEVGARPPVQLTHGYVDAGTLTEVRPPHIAEYTWAHEGTPAGRVRFDCQVQRPVGTRLVVTQSVPGRLGALRAMLLAAWQTHLELLFAATHGDVRCPWPTERTEQLQAKYARRLRTRTDRDGYPT